MQLNSTLTVLHTYISLPETTTEHISQASSYRHIAHSLSVITQVINELYASNPDTYAPHFTCIKYIVLSTGWIPRGKAEAPARVKDIDNVDQTLLMELYKQAEHKITTLYELDPHSYFNHPYFGHIDLASSKKFLAIHTHHHIKIIEDIIKSK